MSEASMTEYKARPYAARFFAFSALGSLVVTVVFFTEFFQSLRMPLAFGLPIFLAYAIYLVIMIYRTGTERLPRMLFVLGSVYVLGGIAFDIAITILKTPSLTLEANPVVRQFFMAGYSITFMYAYGAVAQSLLAILLCLAWATFLRHHRTLLTLAWQAEPKTPIEFIIAAFSGHTKDKHVSEVRLSGYFNYSWYRIALWVFVLVMALPLWRWYLGLTWLGLYLPHNIVMGAYILLGLLPYFVWLWIAYSKGKPVVEHKPISEDLKRRFWKEIRVLEHEGFRFFSVHEETEWPFSVIFLFPIYISMASNEYVRIKTPLRITSYQLIYISADGSTFAYVYGLGCKFYTKFIDGTWLVSNTILDIRDEKVVVQKRDNEAATAEQVWEKHNMKVQEYQAKGSRLDTRTSFDEWMGLKNRFERSNIISLVSQGVIWVMFLILGIYLIGRYLLSH